MKWHKFERIKNMDENNTKNARVFYLTVAVVLAVVAILIVAAVAARRNTATPNDSDTDTNSEVNTDTPTIDENEDLLPEFTLPVSGEISIDYSDSVPVFSQTMNDYRTHLGVDVSAELGSEVLAVANGTVTNVWNDPFMGTCVSIEHSGNAVSIYKNLAPTVSENIIIGAEVKSGDVIGAVGESAMNEIAQEPHLHYELMVNNKHVDPKDHIKFPVPKPDEPGNTDSNTDTNNNN